MTEGITSGQVKQFKRLVEDAIDRVFEDDSIGKDNLQRLFEKGGEFQTHLCDGIHQFMVKSNYELARSILGDDFISPEEASKARKFTYSDEQLKYFAKTIPSTEVLTWCKGMGYALVPPDPFYKRSWLAMKKTIIKGSDSCTWSEQQKLLSYCECAPDPTEVKWFLTTYFEVRGIRLMQDVFTRTSEFASNCNRIYVGSFDLGGLTISLCHDGYLGVGLSPVRRL